MAKAEIRSLTGLRGLAAGMVALYHFWPEAQAHAGPLRDSVGRFYLWVDLFFVLSGFVIALNYAHLFARGLSNENFTRFLIRRLARIYPLYLFMVLIQVVCALTTQGGFHTPDNPYAAYLPNPVSDIFANLLLVQSWGLTNSVVGTAWSISTEWAAYLIFPLLVVPALCARPRTAMIVGFVAVLLLAAAVMLDLNDGAYHSGSLDAYSGTQVAPLLRCFGDFTLGVLMYRLSQARQTMTWIARDVTGFGLMIGLVLTFTTALPDLVIVALFPPLVAHLSANRGLSARLLANPAMVRLGELSYAIYLLHPLLERPSQNLADRLYGVLPPVVAFVLAGIAISVALLTLAAGAFRWIEQPSRWLLRQAEAAWYERRERTTAG